MSFLLDRRKLRKLLGKELEYTAVIRCVITKTTGKRRVILLDVKQNGKLICDHIWIHEMMAIEKIDDNAEVIFNAIASTYNDSKGERKIGLKQCFNFRVYTPILDMMKHDGKHAARRHRK
jgi:hypothetical protein